MSVGVLPGVTPKAAFELPRTPLTDALDRFVRRVGEISAYIWLALVAVIVVNVLLRYVAGRGYIFFEEVQWHMYAIGFLLGLSYTMLRDGHVRVDILSEHWPVRRRVWVEFAGLLFFLTPFLVFIIKESLPFIERAWTLNEVSVAPGGLPYRWFIKSFLLWGLLLLGVSTLSRLLRCTAYLFGRPRPTGS